MCHLVLNILNNYMLKLIVAMATILLLGVMVLGAILTIQKDKNLIEWELTKLAWEDKNLEWEQKKIDWEWTKIEWAKISE